MVPSIERLRSEVYFSAVRSRGPGGQNVNRTASAAQLFWDYRYSMALNNEQKQLVAHKLARFINKDGLFVIRSDISRELLRNKQACLEKLHDLLVHALKRPKVRRATKPTRASKEKRLETKSRRSEVKAGRAKVRW